MNNTGQVINYSTGGSTVTVSNVVGANVTGVTQHAGTMVLTNTNLYTGATTATGGTLRVDFSSGSLTSDIINSASPLLLGGGTFEVKGRAGASVSQTLASLTLAANTSNGLTVNRNGGTGATLNFTNTAWTRGANSGLFVDLSGAGTLQGPTGAAATLTNGILPWVAVKDATATGFGTLDGSNNIVRYTGATTLTDAATSATTNYKIGANLTLTLANGASRPMNSLEINTGGSGTLTIPTGVTLAPATILADADYTITAPGKLGADNANLTVNVAAGRTLTINNNISGGTGSLTFLGSGTLRLENAQSFTGTTIIAGGTLVLNSNGGSANLASTEIVNNGTLRLNGSADRTLVGNISGSGGLQRQTTWSYIWTLSGNNSYTGWTNLSASNTVIASNTALGAPETGTTVGFKNITDYASNPATLGFSGGITTAEPLYISGAGATGNIPAAWAGTTGVLRNVSGANTLAGTVTLVGSSTVYNGCSRDYIT